MKYAAFSSTQSNILMLTDTIIEIIFCIDLILNFLQSFKHPETYENITDLKEIAHNYIFRGWFFVDFISVFPFYMFLNQTGTITKLFRLFRLPRLIKLIDI